jgi:pyroglutamyl-peptidase
MPTAMRLLVTGFGPFPGMARNPSARLARNLSRSQRLARLGLAVAARVLETRYDSLVWDLPSALADAAPHAVLMLGVAGRAKTLRVEVRAINRASRLTPDAGGSTPARAALERDRPFVLRARAAVWPCIATLARSGVAVRRSINAGRYLCNAGYYEALRRAGATGPLVLFVHVPCPAPMPGSVPRRRAGHSRPTLAAMERGLTAVLVELARQARGGRHGGNRDAQALVDDPGIAA